MTTEELHLLIKTLFKIKFFSAFTSGEIDNLVSKFHKYFFSKGKVIIREGSPGEGFYVIHSGKVVVLKKLSFFKKKIITTLSAGDYFGEIALVSDESTSATVKSVEEGVLFVLLKPDFQAVLGKNLKLVESMRLVAEQRKFESKFQ